MNHTQYILNCIRPLPSFCILHSVTRGQEAVSMARAKLPIFRTEQGRANLDWFVSANNCCHVFLLSALLRRRQCHIWRNRKLSKGEFGSFVCFIPLNYGCPAWSVVVVVVVQPVSPSVCCMQHETNQTADNFNWTSSGRISPLCDQLQRRRQWPVTNNSLLRSD